MALLVKSRGVTLVFWPNSPHWPLSTMAPNNPHTLDWLYYDSLYSPPVAGERTGAVVLWQPSHHPSGCCTLVVVEKGTPTSALLKVWTPVRIGREFNPEPPPLRISSTLISLRPLCGERGTHTHGRMDQCCSVYRLFCKT